MPCLAAGFVSAVCINSRCVWAGSLQQFFAVMGGWERGGACRHGVENPRQWAAGACVSAQMVCIVISIHASTDIC